MRKKMVKNIYLFWMMHFVIFTLVLLLLFLSGSAAWSAYFKYSFSKERANIEISKLQNLNQRKTEIESNLKELSSDFGKEKILRENYSMALPGEKLIIIINNPDDLVTGKPKSDKSWWNISSFFTRD